MQGCEIILRMSNSLFADEVIRSAGASSVASRWTTLTARRGGSSAFSENGSNGSERTTFENVPRPSERDLIYRTGAYRHSFPGVRQYSRS